MSKRTTKAEKPRPAADGLPSATSCVAVAVAPGSAEALIQFLSGLPAGTGAAFVFISPSVADATLDPFSGLSDYAAMPIGPAADETRLDANHGYVCPHGQVVVIEKGRLRLMPAKPGDGRIDSLVVTLAEAYEENSAVVLLGPLGADGVTGVTATKRLGGLALAEGTDESLEPAATAVTAAGIADMRLPAARMGVEIVAYLANIARTERHGELRETPAAEVGPALARIAAILRNVTGNDFNGYKHATFLRRVQRRMQVVHTSELDSYVDLLRRDPQEVQHLFQDLLISVTNFFRDARSGSRRERGGVSPFPVPNDP